MDNMRGSLERDEDCRASWVAVVKNARGRLDTRPVKTVKRFSKCNCTGNFNMHEGNVCNLERERRQDNLCAVEQFQGNWERIPITVDSGAVDSVIPRRIASGVKVKQTEASRMWLKYRSASGGAIVNEGERDLKGYSNEANRVDMTMQVAEVTKPLGSVRAFVKAGNKVVFDEGSSYIENKATGVRTGIEDRNGAYVFDLWIPRAEREKRVSTGSFDVLVNEEEDEESSVFAGLDDLM